MSKVELVVIGASAGGLEGLTAIVQRLSPSAPAVVIVMHTGSGHSYLADILGRVTDLPVSLAKDGERIAGGRILIAPPDCHALVMRQRISLTRGPRENGFRPAIDPLFRTAARAYGRRVMGIILSGALDDGTYGMKVIKEHGGITVVQDPEEATIPSMPQSVIDSVAVDHVVKMAEMAALIESTAPGTAKGETAMARTKDPEPQDPGTTTEVKQMLELYGPPSGLTCPDCGGALWEIAEGGVVRFRCHVGHQFSSDALDSAQHDAVEGALWSAVRVLEEQVAMKQRMAERAGGAGLDMVRGGFLASAHESHRQAQAIRDVLFNRRDVEPAEAVVASAASRTRRAASAKGSRAAKARSRRVN
jgi:two-component system chemotaxis response regulator CheB